MHRQESEPAPMSASEPIDNEPRTYPATATTREDIALPEELGRALGITTRDTVEVHVIGNQVILQRSSAESASSPRGLLRDYFSDWEEINRFIEEERGGWEDRDKLLAEDRKLLWARFGTSTD
jgi:bifunctional DNA-binding transcriptional regulator/antitoxin component of YhaV-PrlF toxin-antitoxin module